MKRRDIYGAGLVLLLAAGGLHAEIDSEQGPPEPTGGPRAAARYKAEAATHKDNPDVLVLPGLLANRATRRVEVLAESTGLKANEIVEFLLIDQGGSHGYEALLWSHARPSDLHRALEFIGLEAGQPADPTAMRFRPEGDRVNVTVITDAGRQFRIEKLVMDRDSAAPLPEEGFVFAGSMMLKSPYVPGPPRYAADVFDPRSIASIYNERMAVLDVPREANQGEVYGKQVVNPKYAFGPNMALTIVLEPVPTSQSRSIAPLHLTVSRDPNTPVAPAGVTNDVGVLQHLAFRLTDAPGTNLNAATSLSAMLAQLVALHEQGNEPHITLAFDADLSITEVRKTCAFLSVIESQTALRLKAPPAGQLFYRAFVPDDRWQTPAERPSQPWELHLTRDKEAVVGQLVRHESVWPEDAVEPSMKRRVLDATDPAGVVAQLEADAAQREQDGRPPLPEVLLVFTAPGMTYGALMRFVSLTLNTHGTVYVFREKRGA